MREDQALIEELYTRFQKKPRKCRKINDSNIGFAERIVCINNGTFYYYPKIQEFQDLDFDKLQYVVPKAGVRLEDIVQLKFPPRKQNQRNYFTISLPKNKILKFTKTLKEIIVDEEAQGEQEWIFYFDYDIVVLPTRQKKIRQAQAKDAQMKRVRALQLSKLKEREDQDKIQKIQEEITSLNQAEELRSGGPENEEYLKKRQAMTQHQETKRRIAETDELFFHYNYRKLIYPSSQQQTAQLQLLLLQQVGRFRQRALQTAQEFIDELSFTPIKFKNGVNYVKNNFKLKFGQKNLNQEFNGNYFISNVLYALRHNWKKQLRVPLKMLVRYKGFKVLVSSMTPLDALNQQAFDDSIIHGHSSDNWKIDFMIVQNLTSILDFIFLKPYFTEVHYQKVQIHLGSNLKVLQTEENPYAMIKNLQPSSFPQESKYKIHYFYDIDQLFPIDLDFNNNINQENVRLRPQYIEKFIKSSTTITHLSAGSLSYAFEDEEGEKEDINVAKASQTLKLQQVVRFVRCLDNLQIIVATSQEISRAMKSYGVNMRYLGLVIKLSQLPYIRVMFQVEGIARIIRSFYREHQFEFITEKFRKEAGVGSLINEAFDSRINAGMRRIRLKQLKQHEQKYSKDNASDFLNLIFGMSPDFQPFWTIIAHKVKQKYEFQIRDPMDYPHGYLLKTILYHCGIHVVIHEKIPLFIAQHPFSSDDIVNFTTRSKVYDFPAMSVHKLTSLQGVQGNQRIVSRLQLSLQIKRALRDDQSQVLVNLSRWSNKVGAPSQKYTLQSFYYYLYHANPDNFQTAHSIAQLILPQSHPCMMQLYLEYAKLRQLDPITLKRAAEIHSMRNLGISHWKTSQILSNFNEADYIAHLIKAESGVQQKNKSQLYLAIVTELSRHGRLFQSLTYVNRAIKTFDTLTNLTPQQQQHYFQILFKGIQNNYVMRTIQELLKLSQILYNALIRFKINPASNWFQNLLFYTFKGFLQASKRKYYLFKLVLIFNEQDPQPTPAQRKKALMEQFGVKWRESRNHINHLKQMLIKLQFGFTQINYLPDFFGQFYNHMNSLKNDDFADGLKEFRDLFYIFGFKYFEDALLQNIYSLEKNKENHDF